MPTFPALRERHPRKFSDQISWSLLHLTFDWREYVNPNAREISAKAPLFDSGATAEIHPGKGRPHGAKA